LINLDTLSVDEFVSGIRNNDKVIVSRTITLLESTVEQHQQKAWDILEKCLPFTGRSIRIGITGVPGAGKSTFIESLGRLVVEQGKKLAVVAIDPSSKKSKGSILGDKTRMEQLSKQEHVFIRPSATGEFLGGVASRTREAVLVLEAAGYDTIFIETVGVGQSETAVFNMVDIFLLLMVTNTGDELQGIKRGIIEMADLIAINKADGDNIEKSKQTQAEMQRAVKLFPVGESGWATAVEICSALTGSGIETVWNRILEYRAFAEGNNYFTKRRREQLKQWLHESVYFESMQYLSHSPEFKKRLKTIELQVENEEILPPHAIRNLLREFMH